MAARSQSSLAEPAQRGSDSLYRRSVVALSNLFPKVGGSARNSNSERERQPLLGGSASGSGNGGAAGPSAGASGSAEAAGGMPAYGATADRERRVTEGTQGWERRIKKPKQVISPLRVEAKVWFANERTWIAWLRVSLLIGSFAVAMLNSASFFEHRGPHDDHLPNASRSREGTDDFPPGEPGPQIPPPVYRRVDAKFIRTFGTVYAVVAIATLLWGLLSYQRRVTLIKRKYGGPLDDLVGPPLICAAIFVAVLVNFIYKVKEHNAINALL